MKDIRLVLDVFDYIDLVEHNIFILDFTFIKQSISSLFLLIQIWSFKYDIRQECPISRISIYLCVRYLIFLIVISVISLLLINRMHNFINKLSSRIWSLMLFFPKLDGLRFLCNYEIKIPFPYSNVISLAPHFWTQFYTHSYLIWDNKGLTV